MKRREVREGGKKPFHANLGEAAEMRAREDEKKKKEPPKPKKR